MASDAGDSGADVEDAGLIVAPPDIPWLDMGAPPIAEPLLTPCPPGWSEVLREDGPVTCHPYRGEPDVCPAGWAHFVGDGGCTPLGAACPLGEFPEGLPTDVEDTQRQESNGMGGRGLAVESGATAEVTRALFSGNRDVGVLVVSSGTTARLSDVAVRQTDEQACASATCSDRPFGVALAGVLEASLVATRFEAVDSALCGVLVAEDGQVDLSLGLVSSSPIGVCLQVEGYAIGRLTESVRYLNNRTNLDATNLPVPEAVSSVDAAE